MKIATNLSTNLYSWWTQDKAQASLNKLSENQILGLANDINAIFSETSLVESKPELTLPRLVVVGTQSSGKSSVLNSIMSMDILPTGKNMVTRTPLDIRLHKLNKTSTKGWVEFGHYENSWVTDKKVDITLPLPTNDEVQDIRNTIMAKTTEIAGSGMGISKTPIVIKIYSPHVPNLSLVDLPGLTMVACIDRGQPSDIRQQIDDLVTSYIQHPRTIIIAVMQARSDLETDLGLALIKAKDPDGNRTIGVLTKPDLMNYETHIGEYLTNTISKNLMLTHGYYVVRNRSNQEMSTMDMFGGLEMERNYFSDHKEYKKSIYNERVGTPNLTNSLNKILVSSITEMLPSVMTEIFALDAKLTDKLDVLGQDLPKTKEGKLSVLNKYVSNFFHRFHDSVESRGTTVNSGKELKDIFVTYRERLISIKPFDDTTKYNDEYFKDIVSSFEGNHMSFYTSPIQVVEACVADPKQRPIQLLSSPSLECVDTVCTSIIDLLKQLSQSDEFSQYPPLAAHIINIVVDELVSPLKMETKNEISNIIKYEEDYIWTDDLEFYECLKEFTTDPVFSRSRIVNLLESYFLTVKTCIADIVPKIIMSRVIRKIELSLLSFLFQNIVSDQCIDLLREDDDIEKQRTYYSDLKKRVDTVKKLFPKTVKK